MVKKFDVFFYENHGTIKPCVVLSPDEMNDLLPYVLVAPITTLKHAFPCRAGVKLRGQACQVALDLICCVPKERFSSRIGSLPPPLQDEISELLKEFLCR